MAKLYKPTAEELKTILENHKHWIREDCEGWMNMKADLRYANLDGANLNGANLDHANLDHASLRYANLDGANLNGANLDGANLNGANLDHANLDHASLRYANLDGANLNGANLDGANLNGANLRYANLDGANLRYAKGITMACPSDGAFVAWKKAYHDDEEVIVKLQIPDDAKRSSATGRKCRADKAIVLAIFDSDGKEIEMASSSHDKEFYYHKGETLFPDDFDDNRWNECSHGIHFFITRQEAEEYEL